MKILIALCIVGAAIYSVQGHVTAEEYNEMRATCAKKIGVSQETREKARLNEDVLDDDKMAAIARCVMEKLGIMDSEGTLNAEVMAKNGHLYNMSEDASKSLVDKCIEKHGEMENLDKKAVAMYKCFKSGSAKP